MVDAVPRCEFRAAKPYAVYVVHDDTVAIPAFRPVCRAMLSLQYKSDAACKSAEYFSLSIDRDLHNAQTTRLRSDWKDIFINIRTIHTVTVAPFHHSYTNSIIARLAPSLFLEILFTMRVYPPRRSLYFLCTISMKALATDAPTCSMRNRRLASVRFFACVTKRSAIGRSSLARASVVAIRPCKASARAKLRKKALRTSRLREKVLPTLRLFIPLETDRGHLKPLCLVTNRKIQ